MKNRLIAMFVVFSVTICSVIGRVGYIALCGDYTVSDSYNSYSLTISKIGKTIYDRNGVRLNNNDSEYVAIIRPNEKCLSELSKFFTPIEVRKITKELSSGYPVIKPVAEYKKSDYIKVTSRIVTPSPAMCRQMLSASCFGLEKHIGKSVGEKKVTFAIDAKGRLLSGGDYNITSNNYSALDGVHTSIDYNIQKCAEQAAKSIYSGAVVVLDANSSQILASVSKPNDYVNRAISSYSVGSVFKLVVSAAAIDNKIDLKYKCNGSITVGDTTYSCQKLHKHGNQNIKEALSNSCNCYFVNLALKVGKDKIYDEAKKMGFGEDFMLYDNWKIKSGNMPEKDILSSKGQLSLLGFGQGQLTDSPIHFASVVASIANGGIYNYPTLAIGDTKGDRVMKKDTAKKLQRYMRYVVSSGTGRSADYKSKSSGKTATAQTGQFVDGKEILHTYFAGFYPSSTPKYAIVVMNENGTSGAGDCAPVFRQLVAMLDNM